MTRRQALVVAGAAALPLGSNMNRQRLPVQFLPHGGGPWPFVDLPFGSAREQAQLRQHLEGMGTGVDAKALLVITAHWEEAVPTVSTHPSPSLLFDYSGIPPAAYQLTWPAPRESALAARVQSLLGVAGIASAADDKRGYDHGTFVPLKLAYPKAQLPVLQLSLQRGLDPAQHIAIGTAIAPLRDEGVFIIGSGMSFHNMRGFGPQGRDVSRAFDSWLGEAMKLPALERNHALTQWSLAPAARLAHPREEHLLPLMVIAGAAGEDRASRDYHATYADVWLSSFRFG